MTARPLNSILLVAPAIVFVALALIIPVGYLLSFGLTNESGRFDVDSYLAILTDEYYLHIIWRTLAYSLATLAICIMAGFSLAYFIWSAPRRWKAPIVLLVLSPLLISVVARTYGWLVVLGDRGVLNSLLLRLGVIDEPIRIMYSHAAVILGLVHVLLPFMVISILASLERINLSIVEAAQTLGANQLRVLSFIIVPLVLPGMAAGSAIVFGLAVSAYVTPALMGGSGGRMMANYIYQQFIITHNWHVGATLVGVVLIISLLFLFGLMWLISYPTRRWSNAIR